MKLWRTILKQSRWQKLVTLPFLILFALVVTWNGWLSDDAYITFRTVDNLIKGYGLTWNPAERVQAYTHPLWMLLLSGVCFITREIHVSSLLLSIAISITAVWMLAWRGSSSLLQAVASLILLTSSKAFVDYSTSGLENPLSHLIIVAFLLIYGKAPLSLRRLLCLSLLAAAATLCRTDLALIFLPPLGYATWICGERWGRKLCAVGIGMLPLVLWELFSLYYYGFPFPNTAYAKLNLGLIASHELAAHGLRYLTNSLEWDPVTLFVTGWGTACNVLIARGLNRPRTWPLAISNLLYLLYVVRIGGDFMSGRFLGAPFLVALLSLAGMELCELKTTGRFICAGLLCMAVGLGLSGPHSPVHPGPIEGAGMDEYGVADEKGYYWHNTALVQLLQDKELPDHDWALEGQAAREGGPDVVAKGSVGFYGYFGGPQVHVVDLLGLADPLLARLPPIDPQWRVGHYGRRPPCGYLETLREGRNLICDPELAFYYDKLSFVIRGPLSDPRRLVEIWKLNTGAYDRYLRDYAWFEGEQLAYRIRVVNPGDARYVYALVWNGDSGSVVMLDDASRRGKSYSVTWEITADGAAIRSAYKVQLSSLQRLDDRSTLNIGVIFSDSADLSDYHIFEYRHVFRLNSGHLTLLRQGIGWHNAHAPGGVWVEEEIGDIIATLDES